MARLRGGLISALSLKEWARSVGGNVTLAGHDISNVDAVVPTNATRTGVSSPDPSDRRRAGRRRSPGRQAGN